MSAEPTIIKKYANRRLYHTGTSTYVTLEDLSVMVRTGEDFVVTDARTGDDLTRTVLTQIIFEEETKDGQSMLPVNFLRQLIRFYGHSLQALVPGYLDLSLQTLTREQEYFREQMAKALEMRPFQIVEDQVRANMTLFGEALKLFNPFAALPEKKAEPAETVDIGELKRQVSAMQEKIDKLNL